MLGHDSFQEVDIFDVSMPVTKYGIIVKSAAEIAPAVRRAFALAESGRKGPVLVDIPADVLDGNAEYERELPSRTPPVMPDEESLERAAELINSAEKPLLSVGGGVASAGAEGEILALARKLDAPVVVSYMGIGCCPPDYPRYLGVLSDINFRSAEAVRECDLFVTVGARFNSRYSAFGALKKRKVPLLQFDSDKAEIDKNLLVTHAVVGDAREALGALLPMTRQKQPAEWVYATLPDMREQNRGTEIIRTPDRGQFSVNISKPRITKGNHWHHTKNEKFLVVSGKGVIRFRDMNDPDGQVLEYFVSGDKLEVIDIPTGYTHNIENLGDTDMVTFMWCNECFDPERPDTYYEEVK